MSHHERSEGSRRWQFKRRFILIGLGAFALGTACAETRGVAFDSSLEAASLIALASDSATRYPDTTVVCFGVTFPPATGTRPPSADAWQAVTKAFPRARTAKACDSARDDVWGLVLLDSASPAANDSVIVWGTQIGEHANVWQCRAHRARDGWGVAPCAWVTRAPQDRGH
jgi:hypothetical protein